MPDDPASPLQVTFTPEFKRNLRQLAKKYRHIKSDLQPIINQLATGSKPGDQVPKVRYEVFKVQAKNSDALKGKSGGYRLIYFVKSPSELVLVTVYSKTEQAAGSFSTSKRLQRLTRHPSNRLTVPNQMLQRTGHAIDCMQQMNLSRKDLDHRVFIAPQGKETTTMKCRSTSRSAVSRRLLMVVVALSTLSGMGEADDSRPNPVAMIFDTDLGNDVDDAMALAVIHALADRGQCELLAVTVTKDNPYAGPCVDLLNTFLGRPDIPIGAVRDGMAREDHKYIRQLATATDDGKLRYPHDLTSGADAPEAVGLLRKTLAGRPDGSVVMVQVGFSTNLARLLDSKPDGNSPLDGKSLVKQKVSLLSIMAGAFTPELAAKHFCEYNVKVDVPNARKVIHEWPTPVVFSGWEIGHAIQYPAKSILEDYSYVTHHPIADAYDLYRGRKNPQPTYDLTSVLYAVRPDRGYFDLSPPGRVTVENDGFVRFQPQEHGPHRYLIATPEQIVRVQEALMMLTSQPPSAK